MSTPIERAKRKRVAWQPIETAPKDGTCILLGHRRQVCSGHYWISANGKRKRWVWNGWPAIEPTHWMSLPDAPRSP